MRLRIRRSTVALVVGFVGLGVLYLEVQPAATPARAPTTTSTTTAGYPSTTTTVILGPIGPLVVKPG